MKPAAIAGALRSRIRSLVDRLAAGRDRPRPTVAATAPDGQRRFSQGTRPVIRWIKGDGLDDVVTRSALAQATRLFGDQVDYCLCTHGLGAARVRKILAWASQPVEWWPLDRDDNPALADVLAAAGCDPDRFGYWWKWFPERVRPDAPEWILDGDMVIVAHPPWFDAWRSGADRLRVTQDDRWRADELYGEYVDSVDQGLRLYSGLASLPPGCRYLATMLDILARQPLRPRHDGRNNPSEQGVVAATMTRLGAAAIPLSEFPFGRAFETALDHGLTGRPGAEWGYHFGNAFRRANPHFERLTGAGVVDWRNDDPPAAARFAWLRNRGQWGREGWSMHPVCVDRIAVLATVAAGRPVLELGTSRGHLAAVLAAAGCRVTTIDHEDRGAAMNLKGLGVEFLRGDATAVMGRLDRSFDLIVADLHGNDEAAWRAVWPALAPRLARGGTIVLYNSHLWKIPEFHDQTGLRWLADTQLAAYRLEIFEQPPPGMIVCRRD